nr:hypothetical protein [uncultured Rhodoferax sp.]
MKHLLWIDCIAGALAGVAMLLLLDWLTALYGMPTELLIFIGAANVLYASYSFSLAIRRTHTPLLLNALIVANSVWALLCVGLAVRWAGTATLFGMAHLLAEALFVGRLASLEWKWRGLLWEPSR